MGATAAADSDRLAMQQQFIEPGKAPGKVHLYIVAHSVVHATPIAPLQTMDAEHPAIDHQVLLAKIAASHAVVII
jgi:hypothetical protein